MFQPMAFFGCRQSVCLSHSLVGSIDLSCKTDTRTLIIHTTSKRDIIILPPSQLCFTKGGSVIPEILRYSIVHDNSLLIAIIL